MSSMHLEAQDEREKRDEIRAVFQSPSGGLSIAFGRSFAPEGTPLYVVVCSSTGLQGFQDLVGLIDSSLDKTHGITQGAPGALGPSQLIYDLQ